MTSCSWPMLPIVSNSFMSSVFGIEVPRDHDALDFRSAFINLGNLGVPEQAFDWIVLHVTVPAEDLDRLRRHPHGGLARHELAHRTELGDRLTPVFCGRRRMQQRT